MRTAPKNSHKIRRLAGLALGALGPALAWAADAPVPNKGDTAWMMTSTALVLLMSVPALGLFGGFSRLFLAGTFDPATGAFSLASTFSKNTPLYELVYVAFQATFAAITCCLILGSLVERIKFSGALLFLVIWFTC